MKGFANHPYIPNSVPEVQEEMLKEIGMSSLEELHKNVPELLKLKGVGRKVADCILLFGFHRLDVFPVDTWIRKVYTDITGKVSTDVKTIRKELLEIYGDDMSGYAQQYLFFNKRK